MHDIIFRSQMCSAPFAVQLSGEGNIITRYVKFKITQSGLRRWEQLLSFLINFVGSNIARRLLVLRALHMHFLTCFNLLQIAVLAVLIIKHAPRVDAFAHPLKFVPQTSRVAPLAGASERMLLHELIDVDRDGHYSARINIAAIDHFVFMERADDSTTFDVNQAGAGSITGLTYTVPPHTNGRIQAKLQLNAMTSDAVNNLSTAWSSLLNASQKKKFDSYVSSDTTASANLSFLGFFSGGGKAETTVKTTSSHMESLGLTEDQITKLTDLLYEEALKMSKVEIDFTVFNKYNDYSVSGDLTLYVMSGTVTSHKGTATYRMLSDGGVAGESGKQASSSGKVIPLA